MGNQEIIDTVVDPAAIQQFNELKAASAAATEQMVIALKAAVNLNNATGGSTTFSGFKKNADAASIALNNVIQNSQKVQQAEDKARAYKAEMDEKAMNRYLVLMSKQQAAREAADAKEIAAVQKKADKLAQIQAEADAKAAKRASAIGETVIGGQGENAYDPNKTGAVVNSEDIARGQAANAAATSGNAEVNAENTAAIQAETEALTEQEAVLQLVLGSYKENISLLNSLKAEQAAVTAEIKALNTETTAGQARQVELTAEQLRLKTAIQQTSSVLAAQSKEMLAVEGSEAQLDASLQRLRLAYSSLNDEERANIAVGGVLLAEINKLDAQSKELALTQGKTNKEVGAYEKAIAKFTNASQLAATGVQVLTRSLVRMVVQFALFSVAFSAIEALYKYIAALNIFNPVATEAERVQKGLSEAFADADYTKAVEGVEQLASNLDLVKKGAIDSDVAINQYNNTIGKTFGYVDNLNAAQKGFIDHKDAYITAMLQEAAANAILADSAKELADVGKKQQDLRNTNRRLADNTETDIFGQKVAARAENNTGRIDQNNKEIADLEKRKVQIIQNTIDAVNEVNSGKPNGGKTGTDQVGDELTARMNASLEAQKAIAQSKINDDKLSYAERLQAANDFYALSRQIEENNEKNQIGKLQANDARIKDIKAAGYTKLTELQLQYNDAVQKLRDAQYKQDQQILKNNIEAQRDAFKSVLDDPNQSYSAKLVALQVYSKKSSDLIKATYDQEKKEAGENSESIKLAAQNKSKAEIELANETASEKLKILKEELDKELTLSKQGEQAQFDALDQARTDALQDLTNKKDQQENDLALRRAKNLIGEKEYAQKIQQINDQFNIDKIARELVTQQTILAIQEGKRDSNLSLAKINGASDTDLNKIKSDSDKDIQKTKNQIAELTNNLNNAHAKQNVDAASASLTPEQKRAQLAQFAYEQLQTLQSAADDLIQKGYANQITALEKIGQQIDDNASAEKASIQDSILSSADKARKEALIDAQAKQQKDALQAQINREKTKQAEAEKADNIAKIIESTALAAIKAPAELGPVLGLAAVPVVLALGAAELAIAAAAPLPKFEKGGTTKGGAFIWGEKGTEIAIEPGGKTYASPDRATIGIAPAGTRIIPNHMLKPEKLNYTDAQQIPWKEILSELKRNRPQEQKRPIVRIKVQNDAYNQKFYR